ncbi:MULTISPECIES: FAD binding domain-containing protein [Actinomadura]|uniref:FAD binding domain-containing protein n=1 Tax=Actinomadura yumaensis TaxID=111807 RepID=A0ABW2CSF5_9ACTN|nr:FAD binding domain-containing protein [Actinomadura sp. J1-007]MWK35073.1 xanthine dehydrogenase family protein subunit M [Actinomadura sp. J1-007]
MEFVRAADWQDALAAKAAGAAVTPMAGATDVMVEVNAGRSRPPVLLDLGPVAELAEWERSESSIRIGAGVTFARLIDELAGHLPGLAQAARTVGSRQIRNRATIGGNLGTAAAKGISHPLLLACNARIEVASAARGTRQIPADDFYRPGGNTLSADELIHSVHVRIASGPQYFAKVGHRNAMVTALCSFAIALHPCRHQVGTGIGAAASTPRRARAAEDFLSAELDWQGREPVPPATVERFAQLVREAADPVDDIRATAAYRRHALAIIARRTLLWSWTHYTKTPP